eukprot:scaffold194991_cov19-Tisochrysis_lutea.AAC.1
MAESTSAAAAAAPQDGWKHPVPSQHRQTGKLEFVHHARLALDSLEHSRSSLTGSRNDLGRVDLLESLCQQAVFEQLQEGRQQEERNKNTLFVHASI